MRRVLVSLGLAAALAGLPTLSPAAGDTEEGRLEIRRQGQAIGWEHYEIARTSTEIQVRGETHLTMGDRKLEQSSRLLLSADFSPRRYDWEIKEPKEAWLRMEFEGSTGTIRYSAPDGEEEQQVFNFGTTRLALLDHNVFHHFLLLAKLYDFSAGEEQTIKVFVPQAVQPGEARVELLGVERMVVQGTPQPVRQLSISTSDNRVLLWLTESGEFVRLRVPLANVEVVAAGRAPS